jgi:hypothetical protein
LIVLVVVLVLGLGCFLALGRTRSNEAGLARQDCMVIESERETGKLEGVR